MLTKQEIFIKVRGHLLAQNERAFKLAGNGEQFCMYRDPDGKMCAAGCLIKNEHYSSDMEGLGTHEEPIIKALKLSGVNMDDEQTANLIARMQGLHDTVSPMFWEEKLQNLGREFGLLPLEGIK